MSNEEFIMMVLPYIEHKECSKLQNYRHHNTTRLNHVYNVAVYSFYIGKLLDYFTDIDFESLIKCSMLHDFYFIEQHDKSVKKCFSSHPQIAAINASKHFYLTDTESNMIQSHMFPAGKETPNTKEAWIIILSDKISACAEKLFRVNYVMPVDNNRITVLLKPATVVRIRKKREKTMAS